MKTLMILSLSLIAFAQANHASACSYQINEKQVSAELSKVAVASLADVTIDSAEVANFSFFESKPTPMCPQEMTYNASVRVSYKDGLNRCVVELTVQKIESWDASNDVDVYSVKGRKSARCFRN